MYAYVGAAVRYVVAYAVNNSVVHSFYVAVPVVFDAADGRCGALHMYVCLRKDVAVAVDNGFHIYKVEKVMVRILPQMYFCHFCQICQVIFEKIRRKQKKKKKSKYVKNSIIYLANLANLANLA